MWSDRIWRRSIRRRRSGAERGEDSSRSWTERRSLTSMEPKRTSISSSTFPSCYLSFFLPLARIPASWLGLMGRGAEQMRELSRCKAGVARFLVFPSSMGFRRFIGDLSFIAHGLGQEETKSLYAARMSGWAGLSLE